MFRDWVGAGRQGVDEDGRGRMRDYFGRKEGTLADTSKEGCCPTWQQTQITSTKKSLLTKPRGDFHSAPADSGGRQNFSISGERQS